MMTCREELICSAKYDIVNDLDGRWETIIEAETLSIKEEAAVAPIYQRANPFWLTPEVKGLRVLPLGRSYDLLKYIFLLSSSTDLRR